MENKNDYHNCGFGVSQRGEFVRLLCCEWQGKQMGRGKR